MAEILSDNDVYYDIRDKLQPHLEAELTEVVRNDVQSGLRAKMIRMARMEIKTEVKDQELARLRAEAVANTRAEMTAERKNQIHTQALETLAREEAETYLESTQGVAAREQIRAAVASALPALATRASPAGVQKSTRRKRRMDRTFKITWNV
jgi:hypothetical protein